MSGAFGTVPKVAQEGLDAENRYEVGEIEVVRVAASQDVEERLVALTFRGRGQGRAREHHGRRR